MRKTSEKYAKEKGITLIALIITIIVMLILIAVTISITIKADLFKAASKAVKDTTITQDLEKIQIGITQIVIDQVAENGEFKVTKEAIENVLATGDDDFIVSNERPGDEYTYIVTFNGNQYGIKDNNQVEYLEGGIYNKYIHVTYVDEATPKYLFENTITQKDVDGEVKSSMVPYTIVGVLDEETGEYKTNGTIKGKSGELNILDLQKANFEYVLKDFFDGDESFYVKVIINGFIEKEQKLTVVQGDEVRYEESFNGIVYTGDWSVIEDENCSGGKSAWPQNIGDSLTFKPHGTTFNIIYAFGPENSWLGIQVIGVDGKTIVLFMPHCDAQEDTSYNLSMEDKYGYRGVPWEDGASVKVTKVMEKTGQPYMDSIIVYK